MKRLIAAFAVLSAGFLIGIVSQPAAVAADDAAAGQWQMPKPFIWDGSFRVEPQPSSYSVHTVKLPSDERLLNTPFQMAMALPDPPPGPQVKERQLSENPPPPNPERLERARRELEEGREQLERERRELHQMRERLEAEHGHHDGHDHADKAVEMIHHMEVVHALGERLSNPHTAALLGIVMAKEHLEPQQRFDVLSNVLKEIDGPPGVRNAAYLVLMETCRELHRDDEAVRLLSAMIVENADNAK